ncbi:MAG TPA: DUF711 family protein [Actinocrinis sp.]|jgi:hypothetical protein
MRKPVIRTVTRGLAAPHPLSGPTIEKAVAELRAAEAAFGDAGYTVQTVRITTRSVFDDMAEAKPGELLAYARRLQRELENLGIDHFSLGPAPAVRPDFALDRLDVIGDLVVENPALTVTALLASAQHGIRRAAALPAARTTLQIAQNTQAGIGNFRFATLFCVEPGHPFFPAGYHAGPDSLAVGLQGAGVLAEAFAEAGDDGNGGGDDDDRAGGDVSGAGIVAPESVTRRTREALTEAAGPVVAIARRLAQAAGVGFGGIDLSPAPTIERSMSIGVAIEAAIGARFGAPGTVAAVGAITRALRTTDLPICGYNGLMLPVLEDPVLTEVWERGDLTPHQLLAYSAICGTGLDTVPLPGATTAEEIAALYLDVATLAERLAKPLSARLFPLPGVEAGQPTSFDSPYLLNIRLPR